MLRRSPCVTPSRSSCLPLHRVPHFRREYTVLAFSRESRPPRRTAVVESRRNPRDRHGPSPRVSQLPFGGRLRRASLLALFTVAVVALAAGLACLSARPAAAKEVSISSVVVGAEVRPNGDLRVSETRVSASPVVLVRDWDLSSQGSDRIVITAQAGQKRAAQGRCRTRWSRTTPPILPARTRSWTRAAECASSSTSGWPTHRRSSRSATRRAAAKRWEDTAELTWQFVGDRPRSQ